MRLYPCGPGVQPGVALARWPWACGTAALHAAKCPVGVRRILLIITVDLLNESPTDPYENDAKESRGLAKAGVVARIVRRIPVLPRNFCFSVDNASSASLKWTHLPVDKLLM